MFDKKQYDAEYIKKNLKRIGLDLNRTLDADLIEYLDTKKNKMGYLKELIRQDMIRNREEKY